MMKLAIESIPGAGLDLKLDDKTSWVADMVKNVLMRENLIPEKYAGSLRIGKVNDNIHLDGSLNLVFKSSCHRCLKEFPFSLDIPLNMNLTPQYHSDEEPSFQSKQEELELNADDLDFSFYDGHEINLSDIVGEQVVLALPPVFTCSENCKGLCAQCGQNLNEVACLCAPKDIANAPWAALKTLKGSPK